MPRSGHSCRARRNANDTTFSVISLLKLMVRVTVPGEWLFSPV